jgi:hypothetical protein
MKYISKPNVQTAVLCFFFGVQASAETNLEKEAAEAMKKASQFYYKEVSTRGGYLFEYTMDMKHRYGEMPARESRIWVKDPATPGVGQAYLNAYEATVDPFYLEAAGAAARALIRWTEDGRLYSERFYYKNEPEYTGPVMKNGWIRTGTFLRNMNKLSQYVNLMKNAR